MLARVPRRRPSCLESNGGGRLSGWLRWSSRSGSGVLNLVCVLSGDLSGVRGAYDKDMAKDVCPAGGVIKVDRLVPVLFG